MNAKNVLSRVLTKRRVKTAKQKRKKTILLPLSKSSTLREFYSRED